MKSVTLFLMLKSFGGFIAFETYHEGTDIGLRTKDAMKQCIKVRDHITEREPNVEAICVYVEQKRKSK